MNTEVINLALLMGITLACGAAIFGLMRLRWPIVPSPVTRIYAGLMTIHAIVNLVEINNVPSAGVGAAAVVANISAMIFALTYAFALGRNTRSTLQAAMALALGSYGALLILMAAGQFAFSPRIFAIATGVAAITLATAWAARRRTKRPSLAQQ